MNFVRLVQLSVQPGVRYNLTPGNNTQTQQPSYVPIQHDDPDTQPNSQGSYPPLQSGGVLQNDRGSYYNQSGPHQNGVTYYKLGYLANPPPSPFDIENHAFNRLTNEQRAHELGLDKTYTPQDFQNLPKLDPKFKPHEQGSTVQMSTPSLPSEFHQLTSLAAAIGSSGVHTVNKKVVHPVMNFLKHLL